MELAGDSRMVVNRGRRASAIAIAALPLAVFAFGLIVSLFDRARWSVALEVFGFTGLVLNGPFLRLTRDAMGQGSPWTYSTIAWLLLFAWILAAKRTPVGDMHWVLHFAIMLIWMMCGFLSIPMV